MSFCLTAETLTMETPEEKDYWKGFGFNFCPVMGQELFEFTNADTDPLTFMTSDFGHIQPDRHFFSDGGSIPWGVKGIPGFEHTRFARSYILHDSNYWHGHFFVSGKRVLCTREQADDLMYRGIIAEGGSEWLARIIWGAVRIGSWWIWNKYRKQNG